MSGETHQAVVAAIVGNLAIAPTKLVAAAFSGSASMLSEAIHSIVDTGNGALMLHGIRRSRKPPDDEHPLGYGHEAAWWTYAVLAAATVFEAGSWYFGYKAFHVERRGRSVVATIRRSKDPSAFAVLLEDSAALLGLVLRSPA